MHTAGKQYDRRKAVAIAEASLLPYEKGFLYVIARRVSNEAIQKNAGLLRFARNDGWV